LARREPDVQTLHHDSLDVGKSVTTSAALMVTIAPDVQCIWKHGVVAKALWTYSSKKWVFIVLRFSRVSRV